MVLRACWGCGRKFETAYRGPNPICSSCSKTADKEELPRNPHHIPYGMRVGHRV